MLKLVFYTKDRILKVRHALPEDSYQHSCCWMDKLEYIITDSSDFTMTWTSLLPDLEPEYARALVELVGARYPLSPNYHKLKDTCPDVVFKNSCEEWVFYGGSFNPWHKGHQACINLLPDDKCCLIIPDRNPYKDLREVSPVSAILEISTKARFKKNQFLVPTFLLENKKNPTVDWVEKLKEELPTLKISLLLGFDSFAALDSWTRASDLLPKLHALYVVSRLEGDQERYLALDKIHARAPHVDIVFLGKHDFEDVSSTEIRKKMT